MEKSNTVWIWALAAVALLFLFGSFGMGGYGVMGFGMGFGFLFMLIFWGVLLWLIITLIKAGQTGNKQEDPSIILKKRYASGEISKKQYGEMKKKLLR